MENIPNMYGDSAYSNNIIQQQLTNPCGFFLIKIFQQNERCSCGILPSMVPQVFVKQLYRSCAKNRISIFQKMAIHCILR